MKAWSSNQVLCRRNFGANTPERDHRMQDYPPGTEPQKRSRDEQVCASVQTWGFAESSIELAGNQPETISRCGTSAVNMGFL